MRTRMNLALSGSGRVDNSKGHPQGEIRGLTKLEAILSCTRSLVQGWRGFFETADPSVTDPTPNAAVGLKV